MSEQTSFVILMVDDNPNNLFTLRALLKPLKHTRLIEADSGTQALAQVLEQEVDLILLDIQMPGMDGFETAQHLQMTERTRHIPIIFITAVFKADEFIRRGYAIGAVDYLTKPIDDHQLLNRIRLYQRLVLRQRELATAIERLKAKEQALAQARDEAMAADRAKSQFLATVSHELNTPLNAILGFSQVMEKDPQLPQRHKDNLRLIWRNGQYLLALINRILEITRLHNQEIKPLTEAFSLDELLTWIKAGLDGRAEAKGLRLVCERDQALADWVLGDARLLRLVLFNLVENAIKYSDQGEVRLSLTTEPDGQTGFWVRDQGPGITPEDMASIFEPFHQGITETGQGMSQRTTQSNGTGIGLHISREYVRLLGGELRLESAQGQGSCFHFALALPRARQAMAESCSLANYAPLSAPSQASHISQLPAELRRKLQEVAESLDLDRARALLETMGQQYPEATAELKVLVEEFRFDRLISLCNNQNTAATEPRELPEHLVGGAPDIEAKP